MMSLRERAGAEYVVGSVHDVDGVCIDYDAEGNRRAAEAAGGVEAMQLRYFDQLADLVSRLSPEVVGHLDLIRKFDGSEASFGEKVMKRIESTLGVVREKGAVLDVNCGAYRRGLSPVYPLPQILERARRVGVGVTLGDDSHRAQDVGVGLDACLTAIGNAGYQVVHYLAREDGIVGFRTAPLQAVKPRS